MMATYIAINVVQALVVLLFAPLAKGVLNRLKERMQSRRGPPVLQPYYDICKRFHKDEVLSEHSSLWNSFQIS
jgi:formate hydrogenlyase subunit 4